jgi:tRNA (cytidine/uridine-2'-O-)-methyltransferase
MIDCALFEPDIPQNTGAIMRLGACFGVPVHIVHPAGFALTDKNFKRAGMDYLSRANLVEHVDWPAFDAWRRGERRRLIALSAHGTTRMPAFEFRPDDVLLFGRESAGLPERVVSSADAVVKIPIAGGNRSLNVAVAASIAVYEALRQSGQLPG